MQGDMEKEGINQGMEQLYCNALLERVKLLLLATRVALGLAHFRKVCRKAIHGAFSAAAGTCGKICPATPQCHSLAGLASGCNWCQRLGCSSVIQVREHTHFFIS